jgi:hypothetical protein
VRFPAFGLIALLSAALGSAAPGCALGTEREPGCHADTDCGGGWTCRAGACFRATTGLTPPVVDGGDAGDGGDTG